MIAVAALPYATTGMLGDITYALVGIVYLALRVVGTLHVASRLFSSERVLTSRFSLRRAKSSGGD